MSGWLGDTCVICAPITFGDIHFITRHILGLSLYHPALLGIPTLPPAGRKKNAFPRFNHYQKPNFWCIRDKNNFTVAKSVILYYIPTSYLICNIEIKALNDYVIIYYINLYEQLSPYSCIRF